MTASPRAHGMDGTLVAPDWPPLTLAEVRPLLAQFPALGEPLAHYFRQPAPVFRRRRRRHSRTPASSSNAITHRARSRRLARGASIPCASARSRRTGAPRVCVRSGRNRNHNSATGPTRSTRSPPGIDLYEDAISWTPFRTRPTRIPRARRWRVFILPRKVLPPRPASRAHWSPASPSSPPSIRPRRMERYLAARPHSLSHAAVRACAEQALELLAPFHAELAATAARARAALDAQRPARLQSLLVSDPMRSDARATAIIDFGLADRTNAVHDLAHAIERNIVEWLVARQRSRAP